MNRFPTPFNQNNSPQVRGPISSFEEIVTATNLQAFNIITPSLALVLLMLYFLLDCARSYRWKKKRPPLVVDCNDFPDLADIDSDLSAVFWEETYSPDDRFEFIDTIKSYVPVLPKITSFSQQRFDANELARNSQEFAARLGSAMNRRFQNMPTSSNKRVLEFTTKIVLYLAALVTCESTASYITATTQFIGSIAGSALADIVEFRSAPAEAQGPTDTIEQLLAFIRNSKNVALGFWESPTFLFFKDTIGVAALVGMCKGIHIKELEIVSERFAKDAATTARGDVFSTIFRSIEFALEVSRDMFWGRNLSKFILGKGVMSTASDLLSKKDDFTRGLLLDKHGMADSTYHAGLVKSEMDLEEYSRRCRGPEQALAYSMKQRIQGLSMDVKTRVAAAGFRKRPFCVLLYGASGVGKTTLLPKITNMFSALFGVAAGVENIATVNENEKYDPVDGKTTVIVLDDVGNSKDTNGVNPLERLIRFNNVNPSTAIKADVTDKNMIPIKPDLLLLTSNVAHINAFHHSHEPQSILNRLNIALKVSPKPYCECPNTGKLLSHCIREGEEPLQVQVMSYKVNPKNKKVTVSYSAPVCWRVFAPRMMRMASDHRDEQQACLDAFNSIGTSVYCRNCYRESHRCTCRPGEKVECTPVVATQGLVGLCRDLHKRFNPDTDNSDAGAAIVRILSRTSTFTAECEVLTRCCCNKYTRMLTELFWAIAEYNQYLLISFIIMTYVMMRSVDSTVFLLYAITGGYLGYSVLYNTHIVVTELVTNRLVGAYRERLPNVATELLDYVFFAPVIAIGLVVTRRLLMGANVIAQQGNLQPATMQDIQDRATAPTEWAKRDAIRSEFVVSQRSKTTTAVDVAAKVAQYTYSVSGPSLKEGKVVKCVGIRIRGNYVLLPKHSFKEMDTTSPYTFKQETLRANGIYQNILFDVATKRDVGADHVCVRGVGLPNNGDLRPLIAESCTKGLREAVIVLPQGRPSPSLVATYKTGLQTEAATINGFCGETQGETVRGDCCAAWVSKGPENAIMGFHNGRRRDFVVSEFIPKSAFDFLEEVQTISVQGVEVNVSGPPPLLEINTVCYDEDIYTGVEPDPRSCVNFSTMHPNGTTPIVDVFGAVDKTRARPYSTIVSTTLSPFLEEEGYPQLWGQPQIDPNRNFAATFLKAQFPMSTLPLEAVQWAIADYVKPLIDKIRDLSYYWKPLSRHEALNGRREFGQHVNRMNMQTSPGLGLTGTKADHMDVTVDETVGNIYTAKPHITKEIDRLEDILSSGCRCAPISKGALKDEPTLKTKTKVRVFFVMPIAFLIIGRMILCPILCLLASNPLLSEQWYGLRTTTDEWNQVRDHLNVFGGQHLLNGDYSSYDQALSTQLIDAAGEIFVILGSHMGYSDYWLTVMRSWFADISNPIYAFNGTLLSFAGYNPSGHGATVAVNGLCNSLLLRCFFFMMWILNYGCPPPLGTFYKYCRFGFVGDDSVGAVSHVIPWFNMINFGNWCASFGMTYTMPDKTDKMLPYVTLEQASMCKRKFRRIASKLHPSGFITLAPIEVNSILKSWHCLRKPQEDEWLIVGPNITQGLRELARHPQEVFEPLHGALVRALARIPSAPVISHLDRTYEDWQVDIASRYNEEVNPEHDGFDDNIRRYLEEFLEN